MFLSWRRLCLPALALILMLAALSGCDRRPAKTPDTSETSGTTVTSATDATTAAATAPTLPPGFGTLDWLEEGKRADGDLYVYSPHYATALQARQDGGALLPYVGQVTVDTDGTKWCSYGMLDSSLRVLTPAIYSSCWLSDNVWFLHGNTPKADEDPRIAKMYARSPQLEDLYKQTVLALADGSVVLDDGYIYYEEFASGYALFRTDGSLTVVDRRLKKTAELPGGDYCWVQVADDGAFFAFHGFDGSVTVRDRTGKTVSRFTRAQIGCDAGYQTRAGIAPASKIFWYKGVGYVTHYDDDAGLTTVSRFLFIDSGEAKSPPLDGYTSRSDQYPIVPAYYPPQPPWPDIPPALEGKEIQSARFDPFTGQAVLFTETDEDGRKMISAFDGDGNPLGFRLSGDVPFYPEVYGGYVSLIVEGGQDEPTTTAYYRLSDGARVFLYTARRSD